MFGHVDFGAIFAGPFTHLLLVGVITTFELTAAGWVLAVGLGTMLAVLRASGLPAANKAVAAFVAYHQNVPMLVQILVWYFGVPTLLPDATQSWVNEHNSGLIFSSIAVGLCMSAYFSEDIRSGLRSVNYGQQEAARSLGLSFLGTMRFVTLPQAVRNALPPFINHTVLLFKNTSLAMTVGVAEMTYAVREIENQTFKTFEAFAVGTFFYLAISLGLMGLGAFVGKRIKTPAR